MNKRDIIYFTETKCRRCGHISDWFFADGEQVTPEKVHTYMYERMTEPTNCHCKNCDRDTIQDYVSFGKKVEGDDKIYRVLEKL